MNDVGKNKRVLGIDPGFGRCGFAILERTHTGKDVLLHSECVETTPGAPLADRLVHLGEVLEQLIATYRPDLCAIERLYFSNNQKTALQVSEARGVLVYVCRKNLCRVVEYGPGEIKLAVTGDGHADKRQVMRMVSMLVTAQKELHFDDEYDAIAIAITAHTLCRSTQSD